MFSKVQAKVSKISDKKFKYIYIFNGVYIYVYKLYTLYTYTHTYIYTYIYYTALLECFLREFPSWLSG